MKDFAVLSEDGRWRSQKMLHLAEILEDYNPYLELRWIPPEHRVGGNRVAPYVIVHCHPMMKEYVVCFVQEYDVPEQVLAKVFQADMNKHDVLTALETQERADELFRMKEWQDEQEKRTDFTRMLMSPKNYLIMRDLENDELVKYDAQRQKHPVRRTIA